MVPMKAKSGELTGIEEWLQILIGVNVAGYEGRLWRRWVTVDIVPVLNFFW